MADFINENNARPTRLLLRSDTITNWLSSSTPLMYGEVGVGYDENGTSVIAKIGSVKDAGGQRWADAPQIGASVDSLGLNLESIGRVYSSVVVDDNNKPLRTLSSSVFYDYCSSPVIKYLHGDLGTLPHSLKCGTDQTPPDVQHYYYFASASQRNFIVLKNISGWKDTVSVTFDPTSNYSNIFEAPVGFVHPEFDNVLPCHDENTIVNNLPIQPVQTPMSVLSWIEDVEMWTIPISVKEDADGNARNDSMQFLGIVSGWFPFPYRQFLCDGDNPTEPTDGFRSASIDCSITLTPNTGSNLEGTGGVGTFTVSAQDLGFTCDEFPEYCENQDICGTCMNWSVSSLVDWIEIVSVSRNQSDCEPSTGTVYYRYEANTEYNANQRVGKIRVYMRPETGDLPTLANSADFTFTQEAPQCELVDVTPSKANFDVNASKLFFTVSMNSDSCTFDVSGSQAWLNIGDITSTGFSITPDPNTGAGDTETRVATITVTNSSITDGESIQILVTQAGNICEVDSVAPLTNTFGWNFDDTDGLNPVSPTFNVDFGFTTEDETCEWQAQISRISGNFNTDWITITDNESGAGSETVSYTSSVNPSIEDRVIKISVIDGEHTVTQEARPCTLEFPIPLSQSGYNFQSCGSELLFQINSYTCGRGEGCAEFEECSWRVDFSQLGNNGVGGETYEWLTVVGLGYDPDSTNLPVNTVMTGTGFIRLSAESTCGEVCTGEGDLRNAVVPIIPMNVVNGVLTDATENLDGIVEIQLQQSCGLQSEEGTAICCACTPDNEACSDDPCAGIFCAFYTVVNGECVCACDAAGNLPDEETGNCYCCIINENNVEQCGYFCPPPSSGSFYATGGTDDQKPTGFTVISIKDEGLAGTVPGIIEIDVLRYANTFVKIKGYLSSGVSPVWNETLNMWEPKVVPNLYTNEIAEMTGDGFVYWDFTEKAWKLTNVIDGGTA